MVKVENLSRSYGSVKALSSVSFLAEPGRITAFLGPNGAGKTTTLKILAGFLYQDEGSVSLAGFDMSTHPLQCRALTGYLPENNPLYEDLEVSEFLLWSGAARGLCGAELRVAVKTVMEKCGLFSAAGKAVGALSKGYRQRVGIANAILHSPKILLLDEPTSALDPNQAAEVRTLIKNLSSDATVLLSTHLLSEAETLCDKVVLINKGRIAAQGSPQELARVRVSQLTAVFPSEIPEVVGRGLSSLEGVTAVRRTDAAGEARFELSCAPGRDLRQAVVRLCAHSNWPLLELWAADSFEALFRELTQ